MSDTRKLRPRGRSAWPLDKRFWDAVDTSGECWLWTRGKWKNGYGLIHDKGKALGAHRVSYELAYGVIPAGMWVLHRCDVRHCVRPDHLFLGTNADNVRDMWAKGRGRGLDPHFGKLTTDQRRQAVALIRSGMNKTAVGAMFGVSRQAIGHLLRSGLYG